MLFPPVHWSESSKVYSRLSEDLDLEYFLLCLSRESLNDLGLLPLDLFGLMAVSFSAPELFFIFAVFVVLFMVLLFLTFFTFVTPLMLVFLFVPSVAL